MLPLVSSLENGLDEGQTSPGAIVATCTMMQKNQKRPERPYRLVWGVFQNSFETSRIIVCNTPSVRPEQSCLLMILEQSTPRPNPRQETFRRIVLSLCMASYPNGEISHPS